RLGLGAADGPLVGVGQLERGVRRLQERVHEHAERVYLAALHVLAGVPGAPTADDVARVALERALLRRAGDGVHVPQGDLGLFEGPRAAEAERAAVAEHGERVGLAEQLLVRLA